MKKAKSRRPVSRVHLPAQPPAPAQSADTVVVRHCRGFAEFTACIEIERAVWASADIDIVPLPIFVVAAETGGEVLGAFDGDRLAGFTLALAGLRGRRGFLHSHMTAVLEPYRNLGVGRKLKLFQRQDALARGIELVEWTFDPLEVRNAHFNFGLGAIARRYLPNLYGITTSPLHAGLPTDRVVAEWWLRSARVRGCVGARHRRKPAGRRRKRKLVQVRTPTEMAVLRRNQPDEAARIQSEIRLEFEHWFSQGYAATAIKTDPGGSTYLLEPWSKQG